VITQAIDELAHTKLTNFRVAYKRNADGEHVVALVFPSLPP
jgi:hypothetical protein